MEHPAGRRFGQPYEYVIYAVVIGLAVIFVARWWWGKRPRRDVAAG